MIWTADNSFTTTTYNTPGCGLKVRGTTLTSGVISMTSDNNESIDPTKKNQFDISISASDGHLTITTDMPADPDDVYASYITAKTAAMENGGYGVFGTYAKYHYNFEVGYSGITKNCLMRLNNIPGPTVNFNPSLGITANTTVVESGLHTKLARISKCDGGAEKYNELFKLEMIIYHALNKIAWRLLRDSGQRGYIAGTWQLYQGVMAAWTLLSFRTQFLASVTTQNESIGVTIGWMNPSCITNSFVVFADVKNVSNAGEADLYKKLVMYPMGVQTNAKTTKTDHPQDANQIVSDATKGPIFFVIANGKVYSNASSLMSLSNALSPFDSIVEGKPLYDTGIDPSCPNWVDSYDKNSNIGIIAGLGGGGSPSGGSSSSSVNSACIANNNQQGTTVQGSEILTGSPTWIEDVSDFQNESEDGEDGDYNTGSFRIGLIVYGVKANDGYAKQFYMGLPPMIQNNISGKDNHVRDAYNINVNWRIAPITAPNETGNIVNVEKDLGNFTTFIVSKSGDEEE